MFSSLKTSFFVLSVLAVISSASSTLALQAPYLISATAQSDTGILLSWRNNDAASTGFIIQRKDTSAVTYHLVDSVRSASQLTYLDSKTLKPSKLYTYQVHAYTSTSVSDTSNSVQATTLPVPAIPDTFKAPVLGISSWNYNTSKSVKVTIIDQSNCETGYRIYRDSALSSSFKMISQMVSAKPAGKDTLVYIDQTVAANTWYRYRAAAYHGTDSLLGNPCSTYTFSGERPRQLPRFSRLGNFPISSANGWAAKSGDSIILRESNAPAGKFTAINIQNPADPHFAGYIDSTALLAYPQQTCIPTYLKYGIKNGYGQYATKVFTFGDRILTVMDSTLRLYKVAGSGVSLLDSMKRHNISVVVKLNDSIAACVYDSITSSGWSTSIHNVMPVKISSSGLAKFDVYQCGVDTFFTSFSEYERPCLRGLYSSQVLIGINKMWVGQQPISYGSYLQIHDLNAKSTITFKKSDTASLFAGCSGIFITPDQFLSLDTNFIYSEDRSDFNAYRTAVSSGAILNDSIKHRQNVIIDTVQKHLFIIYNSALSIFSYSFVPAIGISNHLERQTPGLNSGLVALYGARPAGGVTILLPVGSRCADLCFYDLSGRLVDKLPGVTSNAVVWRPRTRGKGCYLVSTRINGVTYSAKIVQ